MRNIRSPSVFPNRDPVCTASNALRRWQAAATPVAAASLFGGVRSLGVIVPHADDETLGCGGLIAAATAYDIETRVTVLTDGSASHPGSREWPPERLARQRQHEVKAAVALLTGGTGKVCFADAPDGRLSDHPDAASRVAPADLYVTCWEDDPHPDHAAAFAIAHVVARRTGTPLLAFPLWVLTTDVLVPALPLLQLDISAHLDCKRTALAAHQSQLGALVADIPGFVLDETLQQLFVRADELFVRVR
jgi:LmbE family N-acetylglucosaminyl deacetylase